MIFYHHSNQKLYMTVSYYHSSQRIPIMIFLLKTESLLILPFPCTFSVICNDKQSTVTVLLRSLTNTFCSNTTGLPKSGSTPGEDNLIDTEISKGQRFVGFSISILHKNRDYKASWAIQQL